MNIATMYEALLVAGNDRLYEILLMVGYAVLCLCSFSEFFRKRIDPKIHFLGHLVVTAGYGIAAFKFFT